MFLRPLLKAGRGGGVPGVIGFGGKGVANYFNYLWLILVLYS